MDDNRVSPMEERALTNAIERAATVASINQDLDRNQLLANQLKNANIDPKFAKTASQAFNKRLTVLTFQKTADEHKADSFPLTDADVVYSLVTGADEAPIFKAASFIMSIDTTYDAPAMEKAASVVTPAERYEHRVSMETFEEHLDSMMDKYASAVRDLTSIKLRLENQIEDEATDVANLFKQAHYDYDFTTAVNLYGDKLKEAIGDKLDKSASFEPTSRFVIKPQKEIFKKVAQLIEDRESLQSITDFMSDFVTGVKEFCKSAAALSEEWQMKKVAAPAPAPQPKPGPSSYDLATQDVRDLTARLDAALARSAAPDSTLPARASAIADVLGDAAASFTGTGIKSINDITGAARTALGNARAMYNAGNNVSISPGDLLDAAFLTKDRYRDRLLAWSDMSADPQLALYPAEQVFQATNKAMDFDTSLERPDQRELLRVQVAQLLAQNNRASTADIAALAETLKGLSAARSNAAVSGADAVGKLSDKEAPSAPELEKIVGEYGDTEGLKAMSDAASDHYDKMMKEIDKLKDKKDDVSKTKLKAITDSLEKAKGRQHSSVSAGENAERQAKARELERQGAQDLANLNNTARADLEKERMKELQALLIKAKTLGIPIPKNLNFDFSSGDRANNYTLNQQNLSGGGPMQVDNPGPGKGRGGKGGKGGKGGNP